MSAAPPSFHPLSVSHLVVLALTTGALVLLINRARTSPAGTNGLRGVEVVLAIALLAHWPLDVVMKMATGIHSSWQYVLPMYLCNWAAIACGIALLNKSRVAAELSWYWGMAGTFQGLITPALTLEFPHPAWFVFFLQHAGVVIAAIYLVFGCRLRPSAASWWLAILGTEAYFLAALLVNHALGTNYGFLNNTPGQPSLLDWLGSGTNYLFALQGVGFVVMTLLWLPFQIHRHRDPLNR